MVIFKGLKFIGKSLLIAILSIVLLTISTLILTNIDLSFLDNKPQIDTYNEEFNIDLPTYGKCVATYSDVSFGGGEKYIVFEMDDNVKKQDFIDLGFENTDIYNDSIYESLSCIHNTENISYKHMFDVAGEYLIKFYSKKSNKYYFIYDSQNNKLLILEIH